MSVFYKGAIRSGLFVKNIQPKGIYFIKTRAKKKTKVCSKRILE